MVSAKISNKTRKNVYARDHYRYAICDSSRAIQIHHVIARSGGGNNTEQNLITLCRYRHREVHGTHFPDIPDWIDREYMEQAVLEYMADTYETFAKVWWPYARADAFPSKDFYNFPQHVRWLIPVIRRWA